MQKQNYKGKCEKRTLSKCEGTCRTYSDIATQYALKLETAADIESFRCNVPLEGLADGDYTSDFVCKKTNGDLMVCECVRKEHLTKPLTVKLLDVSLSFWTRRGVKDWRIIINEE